MTTHEALVKARAYLLRHGWRQGDYGEHGAPRCALGALKSARGEDFNTWVSDVHPSVEALGDIVGDKLVCEWNDQPGRTFEQVIDAFDKAILATAPPKPDESPLSALEDLPAEQYLDCLSTLALIPMEALA